MNKSFRSFMFAIPSVAIFANVAVAQPQGSPDKIPVKLQVVISTFEGDRKVSSMPYTLLATINGGDASFNSNLTVPIQGTTAGTVTYTNLGSSLRCTVTTDAAGFKVAMTFSDRTVISNKATVAPGTPAGSVDSPIFHDVMFRGDVSLKDGETKQLLVAPDKVTGEVVKIDVTLTLDVSRRGSVESDNGDVRAALELTAVAIPFSLN